MTIRAVWESPSTDQTSYYEIGQKQRQIPGSGKTRDDGTWSLDYEWVVGRIVYELGNTIFDAGCRIIVFDEKGERRVSLPPGTCGWEWIIDAEIGGEDG